MQFGHIWNSFNNRLVILVGGYIFALFVFLSSYATGFLTFLICYSICAGVGFGIIYTSPLKTAWPYFPDNKGAVSGFIMCGYSTGAICYANWSKVYLNPNNLPPDYTMQVGSVIEVLYSPTHEVTQAVPSMLRILGVVLAVIITLAAAISQPLT
jgi:hypothetical protein